MRLADIDPDSAWARRRRKQTLNLLAFCAICLIPWTIMLALTLPRQYDTHHWRLAWVGFDVMLMAGLASTAYLGWRGRQMVIGASLATAMLLICDAWFDVSLDLGTPAVWMSLGSAVFIELPLAAFLISRARLMMLLALRRYYDGMGQTAQSVAVFKAPLITFIPFPEGERGRMVSQEREHQE
jgi:hypothetical protein